MKYNRFFLLFVFGITTFNLWSQTPIEAKNLLELASKRMKSYDNIQFEFNYVLNNRIEKINQESSGKVTVSGEKYKLIFMDAIQLFDGRALYTIVPENEEITVTEVNDEEDFGINPNELLQFYKKGYDYQLSLIHI